jgi:hypothetical protein
VVFGDLHLEVRAGVAHRVRGELRQAQFGVRDMLGVAISRENLRQPPPRRGDGVGNRRKPG